jgi:hypothetical protein
VINRENRRAPSAAERLRCRAAILTAWAILICAVSVPTASARLVEETVDTVGSTVRSVQDSADAVPLLPGTSPLGTPPSQAATPATLPQAPPQVPTKEPSTPSSRAGAGAAALPPSAADPRIDRVADAAQRVIDPVAGVGSEAASGAATSERSDEASATASPHRVDRGASEAIVRERRRASSHLAVGAAEVAALQRWLARVWPAISLGPSGVGAGVVGVIARDLFRSALVAATGALLVSSPILPSSGNVPPTGHHGVAGASRSAPQSLPAHTVGEGGKTLYLIALVGLLALMAFTVWREFRIALHPGSR